MPSSSVVTIVVPEELVTLILAFGTGLDLG